MSELCGNVPLNINPQWLLTKKSQSKKLGFTNISKCHAKIWKSSEVVKDFKLKFLIIIKRFVHKKWKIAIGVSLDFLVSNKLQNCKILKTCIKMLCSIYHTILVVDKRHAYESFGKRIVQKKLEWINNGWSKMAIQKKSRGKKNIFIIVEANTNLG